MSATLEDVINFIESASDSDLSTIVSEITEKGYEYECYECETHECEECSCDEDMNEEKENFIRHLAQRLNQFGLDDMLSELEEEARSFGMYIKLRAVA
ncbi:hypothetical protein B9T31_12255 [Acinetobacter sp. ANC 4558]|uniref:hypothetical protein n=1 Tax=Acinetobacter sp. ANC 4558 TaxID=1977876 RepID=UPI000A35236B|nr:hypothetical protein [Acinetobacter sp. ANC 4558]OTG85556.1 hypothetical protein B9T31_12255 [Acinetobacter sp. ANC 4558]